MVCTDGSENTLRRHVFTRSTLSRTLRAGLVWLGETGCKVWSEEEPKEAGRGRAPDSSQATRDLEPREGWRRSKQGCGSGMFCGCWAGGEDRLGVDRGMGDGVELGRERYLSWIRISMACRRVGLKRESSGSS